MWPFHTAIDGAARRDRCSDAMVQRAYDVHVAQGDACHGFAQCDCHDIGSQFCSIGEQGCYSFGFYRCGVSGWVEQGVLGAILFAEGMNLQWCLGASLIICGVAVLAQNKKDPTPQKYKE